MRSVTSPSAPPLMPGLRVMVAVPVMAPLTVEVARTVTCCWVRTVVGAV